jgi:hypothetical protein
MNLSIVNDSSHDRSEHESAEVDVNSSPLKEAYSSLLSVMFSNSGCALEVRAARAMFSDRSQVVLIPRQRPVFASAMKFEDFLGFGRTAVNCSDDWVETTRVQESFELEAPARPRLQPRRIQA